MACRGLVDKCDEGNTWMKVGLVRKIILKQILDTDNGNQWIGLFCLGIGAGGMVMKKRQETIIFRNIREIFRPSLVL